MRSTSVQIEDGSNRHLKLELEDFMMSSLKVVCAAATFVGANIATVATSSAMPISPEPQMTASTLVQQAGWRCGPGWHVNPWGRCVPNRWGYGPRWRYGWGYRRYGGPWRHW
jgi:hypothetical protein